MWLSRSHTTSALEEVAREAKEAEEREKRSNVHFKKKLPKDAEASNILVGEVLVVKEASSLASPPRLTSLTSQLLHLFGSPSLFLWATSQRSPCKQGFLNGHIKWRRRIPYCRFLFILLGPPGKVQSYHEIGRAMASSFADEVKSHHSFLTNPDLRLRQF